RAVQRGKADGIMGEIARAIGGIGGALADIGRPGLVERDRKRLAHFVALGERGALFERRHAARIGPGERIAEREARNTVGVPGHVDQRLHGRGGHGDEVVRGGSALICSTASRSSTKSSVVIAWRTFSDSPEPRWS